MAVVRFKCSLRQLLYSPNDHKSHSINFNCYFATDIIHVPSLRQPLMSSPMNIILETVSSTINMHPTEYRSALPQPTSIPQACLSRQCSIPSRLVRKMCIYVHGKLPVTDIVRHSIIFTDLKVTTREFDIVSSKQSGSLEGLCLANGAAIDRDNHTHSRACSC